MHVTNRSLLTSHHICSSKQEIHGGGVVFAPSTPHRPGGRTNYPQNAHIHNSAERVSHIPRDETNIVGTRNKTNLAEIRRDDSNNKKCTLSFVRSFTLSAVWLLIMEFLCL